MVARKDTSASLEINVTLVEEVSALLSLESGQVRRIENIKNTLYYEYNLTILALKGPLTVTNVM